MTIITNGDMAMRRLHPTIAIVAHDVTVRARVWIVAKIGGAFAITKGKEAKAQQETQSSGERYDRESFQK